MAAAFWKSIVVAIIGLLIAIVVGEQIGEGSVALPVILLGCLATAGLYLLFFRNTRIEALIVGFLVFGYIVGNRGFAQISVTRGTPLFLGEVGLAICAVLLIIRVALYRDQIIPRTALGWSIVVFMALATARLVLDIGFHLTNTSSLVAVRDFATVYYASFFFVVYQLGQVPNARKFLERCIMAGYLILPAVILLQVLDPQILLKLSWRGNPLLWHKYDLTTAYLAAASCFWFLRAKSGTTPVLGRIFAPAYLGLMLAVVTRAALFGLACALVLLLVGRQWRYVVWQATVVIGGLLIFTVFQFSQVNVKNTLFEPLSDKVESMTDVSHSGSYRSQSGEISADNNQFRLVWWNAVIDETLEKGPIFGLGFGYDLAANFVREYYGSYYRDFDTRSPHSIWVTVFGRMGLVGLLAFMLFGFFFVRDALKMALRVGSGHAPPSALIYWCGAMVLLASASFGVVLEGPMGAIVFWTFLGLASSTPLPERKSAAPRVRPQPAVGMRRRQPALAAGRL